MPELKKDIQATSIAEKIANDINEKFGITWVTPLLVQVFIVFTIKVRDIIYTYLVSLKASLEIKKAKFVRETQKGDALAEKLAQLRVLTAITTEQVDSILRIVPIDSTLKFIPEVDEFLQSLTSNVAVKIPESAIYNTIGIGGFELLEGVTDWTSLKEKIDEIEFRLTRATALSNYAQAGSAYIDNYLEKIDVYLEIIVTLNTESI
ncbi:MAG: hypothetical protein M0R03_03525 [Novosphingobium sp.]|nr:hypothetical protein [Novosphingobium sp.]